MGMFMKDLANDPYGNRSTIFVYGQGGVGKTSLLFDLAGRPERRDFVFILSTDHGTIRASREAKASPEKYKGRLAIAHPTNLDEFRKAMTEVEEKVATLRKHNIDSSNIWVAVDTLTHLQQNLMQECHAMRVAHEEVKERRGKKTERAPIELEYMAKVDYGLNLAQMTQVAHRMFALQANIVYIALEKTEWDRNENKIAVPSMSGQSVTRFIGDCNVVARMEIVEADGTRRLQCQKTSSVEAKDRLGLLEKYEPADLVALRDRLLA